MINLYSAAIDELSVHYVGNKNREEELFLSKEPYHMDSELIQQLNKYFFKPFRDKEEEYFHFTSENGADLSENLVYSLAKEALEHPDKFHENSQKIAAHLYEQSNHPHIKSGEVYVALLSDCEVDNQLVEGIGIFKSEIKDSFMKLEENVENLKINIQEGINLNKLDKGCLIFNIDKEDGFKVLSVDSNRYDTRYWMEYFLNIVPLQDEKYMTKKYLKLCEDFSNDVIFPNEDRKEQVLFMNKSLDYFAKNDDFQEEEFINNVLPEPQYKEEFEGYKKHFQDDYKIEDMSAFNIQNDAVTTMRKKLKTSIKLDTDMEINLSFKDENTADKYLEKGYDEERGMYYYLLYYNEEKKKK